MRVEQKPLQIVENALNFGNFSPLRCYHNNYVWSTFAWTIIFHYNTWRTVLGVNFWLDSRPGLDYVQTFTTLDVIVLGRRKIVYSGAGALTKKSSAPCCVVVTRNEMWALAPVYESAGATNCSITPHTSTNLATQSQAKYLLNCYSLVTNWKHPIMGHLC